MNRHKGCVLANTFFDLLQQYGMKVNSNDMGSACMGFRSLGGGLVIKFDECVKICNLVKLLDEEGF